MTIKVQAHRIKVLTSSARTPGSDAPSSGVVPSTSRSGTHAFDSRPTGLLERCTLFAPLGKGGMAEVFLAACDVTPRERRPVVIKRLYPHFSDDASVVQMFTDEARLVCGLEHENIVRTLEVGSMDGQCCIAMEYLAGQPLQRLMRRTWSSGGLSIELAVHITIQILEALEYAHDARDQQGRSLDIVHRDISPHNVFVTNDGLVKVLDFGIAKAKSHEGRTAAGLIKGKFAYLAPEQAYGQKVDRRADIWSVGVVLWEMLSGTRLFRADSEAATLRATLRADIPNVSTLRTEVHPELDRILSRALQRHPKLRYRDATHMKEELQGYLSSFQQCPTSSTLANLVHELFPAEIIQQRQLVFESMQSRNYPALETPEASTNASATPSPSAISTEVSHVDGLLQELTTRHQKVIRRILVVLFASVAVASFSIVFALSGLNHQPAIPASHARMPGSLSAIPEPASTQDKRPTQENVGEERVAMPVAVTRVGDSGALIVAPDDSAVNMCLGKPSGVSDNPLTQAPPATSAPTVSSVLRNGVKQKTLRPKRDYGI